MVIFRLPAVSVAVSVAASIAVAGSVAVSVAASIAVLGFAFGSFSAFFEELLHSGDFFGVVFFVGSAIGLCLLGLGDLAMDGQPEMLDIF
jgi:putative exporter of polyketide antibiotics